MRLRDDVSGHGVDDAEKEANLFAAELLMQDAFVRRALADRDELGLDEDNFIPESPMYASGVPGTGWNSSKPRPSLATSPAI